MEKKKEVKIEKIVIDIEGKRVELTLDQVQKLKIELCKLLGEDKYYPIYPSIPTITPWPYTPIVYYTWNGTSFSGDNLSATI